ncbi:MAG: hypothetical protein ACLFU0_03450 [Alphaproteobacteria bacterium]
MHLALTAALADGIEAVGLATEIVPRNTPSGVIAERARSRDAARRVCTHAMN